MPVTIDLDPDHELVHRVFSNVLGVQVFLDLEPNLSLLAREVRTLDALIDCAMEAKRSLEAKLAERSFSSMFDDGDNTAEAMRYVQERRAKAEARQREEETTAQKSVDLAAEAEWKAS